MLENPVEISTRRPMGIETEFGVTHTDPQQRQLAGANASILLSHFAIAAYSLLEDSNKLRVRWDYGDETPLKDARGFELQRAAAHPTQLTDEVKDAHVPSIDLDQAISVGDGVPPELDDAATIHFAQRRAIGNAVLRNGARWYVDHAHPEYSSPEVMTAREAVIWDRAGEEIARKTMHRLDLIEEIPSLTLYKNNTDSKGQSYGTHENYLVKREIEFSRLVEVLIPFFATRQILVGSGRVGIGTRSETAGYQISSRADFFEAEIGLETTLNRPIVNSRDESHADASRFRRLHVIIGDANLFETPNFLKLAMTSLVLAVVEKEAACGNHILPQLELLEPVEAVHKISHDLSLQAKYSVILDGVPQELSAIEIQRLYLSAVKTAATDQAALDSESSEALQLWEELLDLLETNPMAASDRIEWLGKLQLLQQFKQRHQLTWDDARLSALDIQFSDLRPEKSLYLKLKNAGRVKVLVSEAEVDAAVALPPESTRAYLRGQLVGKHREHLDSAGWDTIILRHAGAALKLRFADPSFGSKAWCDAKNIDPNASFEQVTAAIVALFNQ